MAEPLRYSSRLRRFPGSYFLQNLVERRGLIWQLVRRDFQQRYVGSIAGWLWGVIHPAVLLASWVFVFQMCIRVELPKGEVTRNYAMFLLAGFLPWMLFQETVQRSATSVVEHASLITKTVFPAEILPVTVFCSALVSHLLTVGLVVVAVAVLLKQLSPMVFWLPAYMLLIGLFAVGLGWIASSLHVYVRDTAQVVTVLLTLWFWLTPIFIHEQMYPEKLRFLIRWNPLAYAVRGYRTSILSTRAPEPADVMVLAAWSLAAFVGGGLFFRHLKRGFADVL